MFSPALRPTSRAALARSFQSSQMAAAKAKIIYTETDEAPNLATYSLLPIIRRFSEPLGVDIEKSDISVAGRIISHFADRLTPAQRRAVTMGFDRPLMVVASAGAGKTTTITNRIAYALDTGRVRGAEVLPVMVLLSDTVHANTTL